MLGGLGVCLGVGYSQVNNPHSALYNSVVVPTLSRMDPERCHRLAVQAARFGFVPRSPPDDPILRSTLWGRLFVNPVGLAAGFDKDAEAISGMKKVGFGFIEIGSVCPEAQGGNPRPRVFRLLEDRAVINRYGFNSAGSEVVEKRLNNWLSKPESRSCVLGINLGKNKSTVDPAEDYVKGVIKLGKYADYLVINVSSPNTPNLRDLQQSSHLTNIITSVQKEIHSLEMINNKQKPPLLIKIAPDVSERDLKDIAQVALACSVDGIIISNTTISRENLQSAHKNEIGGLSGAPLFLQSTSVLKSMYELTNGQIPLIGSGGIFSGADALEKIESGASLVELYTSMALEGPSKVPQVKQELAALLKEKGYKSVSEAVGKNTSLGK
uniref:Dihydroorotate dehydrogenase (quinone), mitochondrial n=1 Tax=Arcella intermedia TaxID=1963864 RepID=A0A6B2L6X6_9EUKA